MVFPLILNMHARLNKVKNEPVMVPHFQIFQGLITPLLSCDFSDIYFNFLLVYLTLFIIIFTLYIVNMCLVYIMLTNCFAHYWFWKPSSSFWIQFSSFWGKSFNNCFSKDTWVVKSLCCFCLKLFLFCSHSWLVICLHL